MKKRLLILILTIVVVLGITACGNSNTNTENAGKTISDAMTEEMGEVTPAPTEEPAPTPEPTATPEPTLAPIEWTTEEGTLLPTELIVIVKGSPVKLPCTVEEFMARTGEKIFKRDVNEGARYGMPGSAEIMMPTYGIMCKTPDDAESFKDYIIFNINTSQSMCNSDEKNYSIITLPGDIHIGSDLNSYLDIEAIYGKCDGPFEPLWWNVESDNPGWSYDPEVGCEFGEGNVLERGYGIKTDSNGVFGLDIVVSSDKLYELYGVR